MSLSLLPRQKQAESRTLARHSMALNRFLWAFLSTPDQPANSLPKPGSSVEKAMEFFWAHALAEPGPEPGAEPGALTVQEALAFGMRARGGFSAERKADRAVVRLQVPAEDLTPWRRGDHGLPGKRGRLLDGLHDLASANADIFELVTLNGSVGSRDMKPGWSDVDIFVSLRPEAFASPDGLERVRSFGNQAGLLMNGFCMFQMHGVFFCCSGQARPDGLHPLSCVAKGRNLLDEKACRITLLVDPEPAVDYFLQDIVASARGLLRRSAEQRGMEVVLLLHRMYSFPFAWAACFGHLLYKSESFAFLAENYGDVFPQADALYARASELFHAWDIPCTGFLATDAGVNRPGIFMDQDVMEKLEPLACSRIRSFAADLEAEGLLDMFSRHLDTAERILTDGVPQPEYESNFLASVQRIFPKAMHTEPDLD